MTIDFNKIKNILQREYDRHKAEIEKHRRLFLLRQSNRQKRHLVRHHDKLWEVEHLAELFGIRLKKKVNELEFLKGLLYNEMNIQTYCRIEERIKELEQLKKEIIGE